MMKMWYIVVHGYTIFILQYGTSFFVYYSISLHSQIFFVNKYWTYPAFQIFPIYDIIWEQVEDSLGLEFCFMYMYKLIYSEWVCNYFQQLKLRYIYILICILIDKGALFNIQVHFDIGRNIAFKMWCDKEKIYVMYVRTRNAWEMVYVGLFKVTVCFI